MGRMSIKSKLRAEFLMFNSIRGIFVVIENFVYLSYLYPCPVYATYYLGENWVWDTWNFSLLFLTYAHDFTIIITVTSKQCFSHNQD